MFIVCLQCFPISIVLFGFLKICCDTLEVYNLHAYDVRLYLTSLDEFDKEIKNVERKGDEEGNDDNSAEQLEEELCDEQRYADLYADIRQKELDEENKNRKRAEIGYRYDQQQPSPAVDEEEEEEDEPYVKPISLKLPVGIATPDSVRQNLLIERTALFVVEKGPQMEVVIKAKQRHKAEQFGFLDFDHRLHPFYKYLCKQIREKKYVPELRQPTKTKKEPESISSESDDSNSDSDGGYLHPLLCGDANKKTTTTKSDTPSESGFIGPSQKPKQQAKKAADSLNSDLDVLIQKFHRSDDQSSSSSLYSSLMKSLHSLIPGQSKENEELNKSNEIEKKEEKEEKKVVAVVEEQPPPSKPQPPEILYETDQNRINDYNLWHLEFYGRQSPYLPGPPPFPLTPATDSVVESGIAVAAKYVAFQGAAAEQKLIEHNGDKVHFLSARSPYYTFYQSKVRQLQWQIYQQQQQFQNKLNKNSQLTPSASTKTNTPMSQQLLIKQIIKAASSTDPIPTELPVGNTTKNNGYKEEDGTDGDKKQLERREKARLFMERILNERMAEKHFGKKRLKDGNKLPVEPPGIISSPIVLSDTTKNENEEEENKTATTISPFNLSKTITSMIDMHIKKTFGGEASSTPTRRTGSDYADNSPRDDYEDIPKRNKKEKHKEKRKRKKRRERSTTPSLSSKHSNDGSNSEEEKERKRRKHKRRRESRHRKHHHRSSRHRSYSSSSSRSRSPKYSRKSKEDR
ncbi:unnamed protein product [Meloidogyne enterolobii]|uniref:Uncharacterized protein n=2 Tax=Meloidogyne enterolobii TaxID=390850 RepID=A0ACB1AML2_MELEN